MTIHPIHPAWATAFATASAYVLVLLLASVALFVLPYLVFVGIGG